MTHHLFIDLDHLVEGFRQSCGQPLDHFARKARHCRIIERRPEAHPRVAANRFPLALLALERIFPARPLPRRAPRGSAPISRRPASAGSMPSIRTTRVWVRNRRSRERAAFISSTIRRAASPASRPATLRHRDRGAPRRRRPWRCRRAPPRGLRRRRGPGRPHRTGAPRTGRPRPGRAPSRRW